MTVFRFLKKLQNYKKRKKIISETLYTHSIGMASFRHKVIHEYADIDMDKIYIFLQRAPKIFEQYDAAFRRYLSKRKTK